MDKLEATIAFSVIFIIIGYFFGSLIFGVIIGKWMKKDPRQHESKSAGATNSARVLGKKIGILVAILDAAKAVLSVLVCYFLNRYLLMAEFSTPSWIIYTAGIGCVIGHAFPLFFNFKGGKGVSVSGGVIISISPILAAIGLLQWAMLIYFIGYVSFASALTTIASAAWTWFKSINFFYLIESSFPSSAESILPIFIILLICALIVSILHWQNWIRLFQKKERMAKWSLRYKKN